MPDELQRVCEFCGGRVVQCLHCTAMLHCIEVYEVGLTKPLCVLCAAKEESFVGNRKERMYA